ncbi:MAG: RdgB/HAM1 family non-canonical purine NTP pyrophosphatase [Muribaculaceae bacterium]|nr:RdgB/HAM1 family non-canonical purine NTP pyrophosphatase [Muribaculaceae bacterium]
MQKQEQTGKIPKIVFATNNPHKLEEARAILKGCVDVLSLSDINCHDDIPETAPTIEGNALIKARWVKEKYGFDSFADDTGLFVEALDGAPGVYSARFAGPHCSPADNIALLLEKLHGEDNRNAKFATVVALVIGSKEFIFKGEVEGRIAHEYHGKAGFGYDPVFFPENSSLSFAEMAPDDKNAISHRGRAMRKLSHFLSSGL